MLVQNTAHISNKYGFQAQSATATGRGPLAHSRLCHEHLYLFLRIKSGTGRQRAFGVGVGGKMCGPRMAATKDHGSKSAWTRLRLRSKEWTQPQRPKPRSSREPVWCYVCFWFFFLC